MNDIKNGLIPPQETGAETNTEHSMNLSSEEEAKQLYNTVKERLLNVNDWEKLSGAGSANFQLTDASGDAVNRHAQQNDHFRIDIPGPGPVTGNGYDWVQIQNIQEKQEPERNAECIIISVYPATNPTGGEDDVAHFFEDSATSNFMVIREGNTVTAGVYGRNEKPNTQAVKVVDKARNAMIALSAMAGVSKLQWKSLAKGLIEGKS